MSGRYRIGDQLASCLSLQVDVTLAFLSQAHDLSLSEKLPRTARALRADWLIHAGSSATALNWLVGNGFVHFFSRTACTHVLDKRLGFDEGALLVLSDQGLELTRQNISGPLSPCWDPPKRELWFGDRLVKRLRGLADNQELVLTAFSEEDWPSHVDDPIPPLRGQDSHKRLRNVVQRLNNAQVYPLLRFHADGTGDGVCWNLALPHAGIDQSTGSG